MKTYLICGKNWPRAEHAKRQLEQLGMGYSIQNAVYLTQKNHNNSPLTLAEQGCAMAHLAIYEQMVNDNISSAIVLEDDGVFTQNLWRQIPNDLSRHFDIVLLGRSKLAAEEFFFSDWIFPIQPIVNLGKYSIGHPWKLRKKGAVGYWISIHGAKQLLMQNYSLQYVADDWPAYSEKAKIGEIRPLVVFEDTVSFGSEIEESRTGKQNMIKRMTKRKLFGRLLKGLIQSIIIKTLKKSNYTPM
ncbi:MAG: glycosyltransferase family 25 protein [Moraxellaceae bacterium]|nr:glycosyltransferase family 25 protein [Moraxellaceae bacterium]MDZ4385602.1 glycosyltransferase family 25 protein [Moraxellaceae bacterium]